MIAPRVNTKAQLAALTRAARTGFVSVETAANALRVPRRTAAIRLATLARAGWLTRIKRGLYFLLPLESASEATTTPEDPWTLAVALYSPCYVGGWSAAEYWNLTEQLFRSTFVVTGANIRKRQDSHLGALFTLARVKPTRLKNLTSVWRGPVRVPISTRERTIVDAAIDPRWLGGVRHLADVFAAYVDSPEAHPSLLIDELKRSGSGAAAKRLGFLADRMWPAARSLIEGAFALRSTGIIKLDPAVRPRGELNTRWGLWVNVTLNSAPAAPVLKSQS